MGKGGASAIVTRAEDFPRWYQDVVARAELADNGPVRGTMVIRPYGYGIWEQHAGRDRRPHQGGRAPRTPTSRCSSPSRYLNREAEHVEGFAPELAVVTHGGGKELEEPLVVRPTSETIINSYFAKWIQSYRDLPLLLNQWANVVRWELRPRLFLRTTEFLWQEGHTAHATEEDARAYALRILDDVYRAVMVDVLAIPVLTGRKTARERFAGAISTWTCEAMMGDGKALQMGTSHELGQNFAKVFDTDVHRTRRARSSTSGRPRGACRTRMVGALIMAHGDDVGLRLPPAVAPTQVVVVVVKDDAAVAEAAASLCAELRAAGHRVRLDDRIDTSFGRRSVDWELKGVPVRVEVGPRDLAEGNVTLVVRHRREKHSVPLAGVGAEVAAALGGGDPGPGWPRRPPPLRPGRPTSPRSRRPSRRLVRLRPGPPGRARARRGGPLGRARPHRALPAATRRLAGWGGRRRGGPVRHRRPFVLMLGLL